MKINVKAGKSLDTVFCYVARPFPFLPACSLCSQPLPALLHGVALSQILDFAFHIIPCLQPAKVPLKSSTSTSPKFQRVLSAPLPESLMKRLNNVSPSTDPEDALVTGHQLGLPLHFHLSISLCKSVTVCPMPCNNKHLFLYLGLAAHSFSLSFPEKKKNQKTNPNQTSNLF